MAARQRSLVQLAWPPTLRPMRQASLPSTPPALQGRRTRLFCAGSRPPPQPPPGGSSGGNGDGSSNFNGRALLRLLGITDVRWLLALPLVGGVCVIMAYFDAKAELSKEPPEATALPGGRVLRADGSIAKGNGR